jgi:septum formation protein
MTRLVLGSASSGRLKVLRQAGIDPLIVVSGVDEDAVIAALGSEASPGDVVGTLAQAKADQVATNLDDAVAPDCVVIGCDSMLYLDGRLVGKPASADAARSQWQLMGGRSGQLYTGHCLLRLLDGNVVQRVSESASTTVHFAKPSAADLDAYIDSGEPLAVAGGFTLDGLGGWFVDRIEGDPSNVIGLSLPLTRALLQRVGLSVAELW